MACCWAAEPKSTRNPEDPNMLRSKDPIASPKAALFWGGVAPAAFAAGGGDAGP